jgi:hypothetical protein
MDRCAEMARENPLEDLSPERIAETDTMLR